MRENESRILKKLKLKPSVVSGHLRWHAPLNCRKSDAVKLPKVGMS